MRARNGSFAWRLKLAYTRKPTSSWYMLAAATSIVSSEYGTNSVRATSRPRCAGHVSPMRVRYMW
jgi:hypothetical protein